MNRVLYLVILSIVWLGFWKVVPFGLLPNDVYNAAVMLLIAYGLYYYRSETELPFWTVKMVPVYLILGGIFLSMIPAYLYYGQSLFQSLITYRVQFLWLIVPLLFRMVPKEEEIVKVAYILTLLMWGVFFLRLIAPEFVSMDEETLTRMEESERTIYITGFTIASIPIYYYLGRIREEFSAKHLIPIMVCYAYLFAMQNRSLLFPITLFIGFTLLQLRAKYRYAILVTFGVIGLFFIAHTIDTWMLLFENATEEINDTDYNRNVALAYFFTSNEHFLNDILGNGFISEKVSDIMASNMEMGIFNSDVGFVGYWNQFGIIPLIAIFWLLGYAIVKRGIPYYMKLWSIQILICCITISYFGASSEMLFFSFFIYLLFYNIELSSYEDSEWEEQEIYEIEQQNQAKQ